MTDHTLYRTSNGDATDYDLLLEELGLVTEIPPKQTMSADELNDLLASHDITFPDDEY